MFDSIETRQIGGWIYHRQIPLGGHDGKSSPELVTERIEQCVLAVREDKDGQAIESWYAHWLPDLTRRIVELRIISLTRLAELTADELEAHLTKTIDLLWESARIHFTVNRSHGGTLYEFTKACRELLGWDEARAFELLSGLSAKSTEPARRLAALVKMARSRPSVARFLENLRTEDEAASVMKRLRGIDADFATAFAAYREEYGVRALSFDVAEPTYYELPQEILRLLSYQMEQGYDMAAQDARLEEIRNATREEALNTLASRPSGERARFERALSRAQRCYPTKEDNEFYTLSAPLGLIRLATLELGRRLVRQDVIDQTDDVFLLELTEARAANKLPEYYRSIVSRRRSEKAWAEAHPGPSSYGTRPAPPPMPPNLPPEVRLAQEKAAWIQQQIHASVVKALPQNEEAGIRGVPASAGRYTGPARVIMDESDFGKVRAGDVLICPTTSPSWSMLFSVIGALVTDHGGMLSHPAIIAREFCIPAIIAVNNATAILRDGETVTVDGSSGIIVRHETDPARFGH